jgi:hypothetical protein
MTLEAVLQHSNWCWNQSNHWRAKLTVSSARKISLRNKISVEYPIVLLLISRVLYYYLSLKYPNLSKTNAKFITFIYMVKLHWIIIQLHQLAVPLSTCHLNLCLSILKSASCAIVNLKSTTCHQQLAIVVVIINLSSVTFVKLVIHIYQTTALLIQTSSPNLSNNNSLDPNLPPTIVRSPTTTLPIRTCCAQVSNNNSPNPNLPSTSLWQQLS